MTRTALLLALSLALFPACKKKGDDAAGGAAPAADKAADKSADKPTEPEAPKAGAPVKTTPKDLFAEFTDPKADGMKLLDKYQNGATFTAPVKTVGAEESGKPVVMLDVDGKNMISVDFTDPVAAKAKDLKAGDSLTVTCKIGGASGALMMVIDCVRS